MVRPSGDGVVKMPGQTERQATPRPKTPERLVKALHSDIARIFGVAVLPRLATAIGREDTSAIEDLTALAVRGDASRLSESVCSLQQRGHSAEHICQHYLTAVAGRLGEWWDEDRCSFVEVTLGVLMLQDELRRLAPALARPHITHSGKSVLMLPSPGEQHGFGLAMLAEYFRAAGWDVEMATAAEAPLRIAAFDFHLVAITLSDVSRAPSVTTLVAELRRQSRRADPLVMVGGSALLTDPALLAAIGADTTAPDAASALHRAETLLGLLANAV